MKNSRTYSAVTVSEVFKVEMTIILSSSIVARFDTLILVSPPGVRILMSCKNQLYFQYLLSQLAQF